MLYKIKAICLLLACCCIGSVGMSSSASEAVALFQEDLSENNTFTNNENLELDAEPSLSESPHSIIKSYPLIVISFLWISYFLKSKKQKQTWTTSLSKMQIMIPRLIPTEI